MIQRAESLTIQVQCAADGGYDPVRYGSWIFLSHEQNTWAGRTYVQHVRHTTTIFP